MIIYSAEPLSLLKAVLLSRIKNMPCRPADFTTYAVSLFPEPEITADQASLDELLNDYSALFRHDLSWLKTKKAKTLFARIRYALRNSSSQRFRISEDTLLESFEHGPDYVLNNISVNAGKLSSLARAVYHEVHRMLGFIRFSLYEEKTLVAEPKLFHDTADLILKGFRPRYPNYRIVLVLPDCALCLEGAAIFTLNPEPFRNFLSRGDAYHSIWKSYYLSQYIESRRNPELAQKVIPKKYRDWMIEGELLNKEK